MTINKNNLIIDRRIKVFLIGCGRISNNHLKSILLKNSDFELVGICDQNINQINSAVELIKNFSKEINFNYDISKLKKFLSEDEIYKNVSLGFLQIDLLVLATPSGLHASQTIRAAKHKLNICTEKPMATNWEDGLSMYKASKKEGVFLFVVKQNRFNSTIDLVRRQIKNGRFGKIGLVTVNVFWQRPQSYYDQDEWRGTWENDGGALMNQASHYVDLLDWMIGPVKSINASIATIARNIEVEDTAALKIEWNNGTLGTMAVTMITYPKNLEGSITILGDKGTVKIGGKAVNKIEHWEFADKHLDDKKIENASYETSNVYGFGHPLYYQNIIDTFRGVSNPICSGEEGLKSLELLIASYRSANTNKTINLPLQ